MIDLLLVEQVMKGGRVAVLLRLHGKPGRVGRSKITGKRFEGSYRAPSYASLRDLPPEQRKQVARVMDNIGHSRQMRASAEKGWTRQQIRNSDKRHLGRMKRFHGTTTAEEIMEAAKAELLRRIVGKKNVFKVHGGPSPNFMQDPLDFSFKIPPEASRWKTPKKRIDRVMHNIEYSRLMRKMKGKGMTDNQIRGMERMRDTARLRPWRKAGVR